MEQNNQQVSQEPTLPIKTKIVAWWLMILGIGSILLFLRWLIKPEFRKLLSWLYLVPDSGRGFTALLLLGPFLIWLAKGLLSRKQWGWWWSMIFISWVIFLDLIWILILFLTKKELVLHLILTIILFILCIFLFSDRRNFWEIAK